MGKDEEDVIYQAAEESVRRIVSLVSIYAPHMDTGEKERLEDYIIKQLFKFADIYYKDIIDQVEQSLIENTWRRS